ncbi:hypothetical protein ACOMHN_024429 [Nucella lapillus]
MIDSSADQPLDPPASKPATHPSAGDDSARGKPSHAPTHRCCDFSHGGAGLTVGGGGRGEGGGERLVGEHPHTRADSCCDSNQGGKGLVGGGGGSGGEGERLVGEHPQARADSCCDSNQESKGLIGGGEEGGEGRSGGEGRGETLSNNAIRDGGGGVVERGDLPMNPMSDSGGGDGSSSTVMVSGGNPPPSSSGNDAGDGGSSSSPSSSSRPVSRQWSSTMLQSISEEDVLHLMEGRDLQAIMGDMPPCQCDDCLMNGEEGVVHKPIRPSLKRQSSWKKIRSIVRWSPFIQVFKKHRYPWIQLAGHQGNFQAGEAGCVLKKLDQRELQSLQKLMTDCLQPFVPQFRGMEERGGTQYLQLQDLLCEFSCPSVMDVKMGVRTFLEAEIMAAKHSPTLRKDMYKKMTEVNPDAPSAEEHAQGAVTKHRYMQWRDQMSSSADLGFRIEGIKVSQAVGIRGGGGAQYYSDCLLALSLESEHAGPVS